MTEIIIPNWHPTLLNVLLNCSPHKRNRLKRADQGMVATYARLAEAPRATGKRRVTLTIVLGPRQRGGDPDAYWKSLLDALAACGQLVDDSRKWVETPPVLFERAAIKSTSIQLLDL